MKKRLFIPSLIIALVLVLSMGLTACGDTGNNGGNGGDTDKEQPQTVAVTTVTLNKSTLTLDIGGEEILTATVKPDNATNKTVSWSSDKPDIASVDNGGKVTAKVDGTAIITATAGGKSDTCTVTVNKAITPPDGDTTPVSTVTLNKSTLTLDIGGTETLTATVKPDNATNKTVTWTSDKPDIASVDNGGKVTAKVDGTAIITATAGGKSDTCTVTVNKEITPPDDTNHFTEIAKTCKVLAEKDGKTNVEVLTIFDNDGYLSFGVKHSNGYISYITEIEISTTIESVKNVDITALAKSEILYINYFNKGVYSTDGTGTEKQMVESMIAKLLGNGYTVIFGTITEARDSTVDGTLGDNAVFSVNALLEKDGKVMEYSESIRATKRLGDVYQAVLNSTETNKDNIYKCNNNAPTDLGELAKLYLAECKKEQQAN